MNYKHLKRAELLEELIKEAGRISTSNEYEQKAKDIVITRLSTILFREKLFIRNTTLMEQTGKELHTKLNGLMKEVL